MKVNTDQINSSQDDLDQMTIISTHEPRFDLEANLIVLEVGVAAVVDKPRDIAIVHCVNRVDHILLHVQVIQVGALD